MAAKAIKVNLIVDMTDHRVVFAECGKDFVDNLLGFLTLPLGTIFRLAGKPSSLHGIEKLYESIESLDEAFFNTKACRSMLLHPVNSAAEKLKNFDWTEAPSYFTCQRTCYCERMSFVKGTLCPCGKIMDKELHLPSREVGVDEDGFVKGLMYTISDDMVIVPTSTEVTLSLLDGVREEGKSKLEVKEVEVSSSDVCRLLKSCLFSRTVLTDVFLAETNDSICFRPTLNNGTLRDNIAAESYYSTKIKLKLFLKKIDRTILYAESNQDFVDLLFSFLTYPLGSVVKHLGGQSHLICIDNLYRSTETLSSANCLKDIKIGEILLNPKLPQYFSVGSNLVKIEEAQPEIYYMCRKRGCDSNILSTIPYFICGCMTLTNKRLELLDPKIPKNGLASGFMGCLTYMVTDDLTVTPLSSALLVCNHLKEAQDGLDIVTLDIGEEEALALLKASISSNATLTDVLLGK